MKALRLIGMPLLLGIIALTSVACATKQEPDKWTLWYIPNEPKPGVKVARPCTAYVFASAPVPIVYKVALFKDWVGHKPQGNTASVHSGEAYSGPLDLGNATLHDESNGYDIGVDVVYTVGTYLGAKTRADAYCVSANGTLR